MSITKRNKSWRYEFQQYGRRYTKDGFRTKAEATAAQHVHRDQLKYGKLTERVTVRELVVQFLKYSQATKSPRWSRDLRYKLNRIMVGAIQPIFI